MNYIDLIIKYLSGELSREETTSFERELESNDELKRVFEEHSAAFNLIRDQLQKREEEQFRSKLREAMSHDAPVKKPPERWLRLHWYIPVAAACVLGIILTLFLGRPQGDERVMSRFFDPSHDPVLLAFDQDTRGRPESGILQYRQGNYRQSMKILSDRITSEGADKKLLLYYLLSAIELDRQDEVMEMIMIEKPDSMDLADQAIIWYSSLALLKSGRKEAALERIQPLTEQRGPYRSEALKLEKFMLK